MPVDTTAAVGARYILLDRIGSGGMGAVYRALDRLSGQYVALKRVAAVTERVPTATRSKTMELDLSLAHEFQALASLRHPHIIGVLDYGFDLERQPYFTMELLENAQTIQQAGRDQSLSTHIDLIVQMLYALAYLHRRGIIHRDLKPGNALVVAGQVKVLDFGIALAAEPGYVSDMSGTLAYMAPEVLTGAPASRASDLYAVGVIAYELLVGRHPFPMANGGVSVNNVLYTPTDVMALGLDTGIANIIARLLAKAPEDRYASAEDVITALGQATGQSMPLETTATRESFLQAARLVGRDAEMAALSRALTDAMRTHGSMLLIGGESGVGKSRLLDEVRTRALIYGAPVVRGQAVSDQGSPYQLWRECLRWLALSTRPDSLEASVLKALVPDITELLGESVPDAPELEPRAAQTRLFSVVTEILLRQPPPVVLILEDLQWAEEESLALLNWLRRVVPNSPLLILGSYRDDDAPDLPRRLGGMKVFKLERLSPESIAELSRSMLGDVGEQERVMNFLRDESEGNVYLLVEIVRALAEEAGQLDKIVETTLPAHVYAGGVQRFVQRRINRVPSGARPLLHIAALIGRQLDLAVLRAVDADVDIEQWLSLCADAAVLEVNEQRWRFAHDKLREGLLVEVTTDQRPTLHRRIAVAIEQVYPEQPAQAAILAYHWHHAGSADKEMFYSARAGEEALRSGANQEAVSFFTRALALESVSAGGLADPARRAEWEQALAESHYGLGHLSESRQHLESTLKLRGMALPTARLVLAADVMRQAFLQISHRLYVAHQPDTASGLRDTQLATARAYERLAEIYYFANDKLPAIHAALHALNVAETAGLSAEQAQAYANMIVAAAIVPLRPLADIYARRMHRTLERLNELPTVGKVLRTASVYPIGIGEWQMAEDALNRAIAIFERSGDKRSLGGCLTLLANIKAYQGQFTQALEVSIRLYTLARQSEDIQEQLWGLLGQAVCRLRLGALVKAEALILDALPLHTGNLSGHTEIISYGLLAVAYLRQGQPTLARHFANRGAALIARFSPTVFAACEGYAGVAETYLALWEYAENLIERDELGQAAGKVCAAFSRFAHIFPMSKPYALLCQGRADWLNGRPVRAVQRWQKSLAEAQRLGMPYEEGLAHYEIGRHLAKDSQDRRAHLTASHAILSRLEAAYDVAQIQVALEY